jgi:hypothetical protein
MLALDVLAGKYVLHKLNFVRSDGVSNYRRGFLDKTLCYKLLLYRNYEQFAATTSNTSPKKKYIGTNKNNLPAIIFRV